MNYINNKKRKNEQLQFSKVKKVMLISQQNAEGAVDFSQTSTDISKARSVMGNKPFRKIYHLGG